MKYTKGITLVSLVITVIIMIILAGVAIVNITGKSNAIDKAEEAKLSQEERAKKDELQQALIKYNSGNAINSSGLKEFLVSELSLDPTTVISVTNIDGEEGFIIKDYLGEKAYITSTDGIWEIAKFGKTTLDFGMLDYLEDGDKIIAPSSGDELEIDTNNYAIISSENLEDISFDIPANTTVNLKLLSNFTVTNEGLKRAAINLNENSVLNLAVHGTVVVNSTLGEDANGSVAGKGGYAGIRVPPSATLNLTGTGTIKCYGGNAGNGGTRTGGNDQRCAGGGGAGAGIGGNGGTGGAYVAGATGASGGAGESCGTVNMQGSLKVYAYGGGGGSGGAGTTTSGATSGGAGGYPAAGIGGGGAGGAGGTCCGGGGGYTGGTGEGSTVSCKNGKAGDCGWGMSSNKPTYLGGGGYFQGGVGIDQKGVNRETTCFGGIANQGWHAYATHGTGFGGTGGSGGNIRVKSTCTVYAYNGNLYTDGTSYGAGNNQCPIYLQAGIINPRYDYIDQGNNVSYWKFVLTKVSNVGSATKSGYTNPAGNLGTLNINSKLGISGNPLNSVNMNQQGVGSGAGYIEVSNGSYTVVP